MDFFSKNPHHGRFSFFENTLFLVHPVCQRSRKIQKRRVWFWIFNLYDLANVLCWIIWSIFVSMLILPLSLSVSVPQYLLARARLVRMRLIQCMRKCGDQQNNNQAWSFYISMLESMSHCHITCKLWHLMKCIRKLVTITPVPAAWLHHHGSITAVCQLAKFH